MKAFVYDRFGTPEVLDLRDIESPALADDGVLVRVHASSVNPLDWHMLTGTPYLARAQAGLRKPRHGVLGTDFAGTVEAVGKDVTHFGIGDDVYGARNGAFGDYVSVRKSIAQKPSNLTFEEAAAVPVAGVTALQALRDKGKVTPGQTVLVNGASGGVGTFTVQLAKALGANVTGVCSTPHVETVRALGADEVLDYTRDDFATAGKRYDLIVDIAGNRSWAELKRVLSARGTLVIVGGPKTNRWVGPLGDAVGRRLVAIPDRRTVAAPFIAAIKGPDLVALKELIEAGKVTPVVERRYDFADVPDALRRLGKGHLEGKLVIDVAGGEA
ncbi:MAG: NAD(P)-dependent alcohol dehydrogenase [Actinobacteria bacterium]|nr:MAG: NAD(P)-dependent alcohol dehydrogenase [Actinomycetota bacterium]